MLTYEQITNIFNEDAMVKLLDIKILTAKPGYAETSLQLTEKHLNSVGITHGAVLFALADVTMAAAGNAHGVKALALNASINFLKPSTKGEILYAYAKEDNLTKKTGVYRVEIYNENKEMIAVVEGTLYRMN